eukprot:TRINITY_DN4626_c0_g1_i3.p1 TRINITY_DN4626_c0_g1~~TRINITY_DN4626_c0_g1_i3.p1  ORF type:complete len:803 (-),score=192.69 TRINITY_DN4626_c0_g1_i3:524-2932(-)
MSLVGRGLMVFGAMGISAFTAYTSVQQGFENSLIPFRERMKDARDFFGSLSLPEKKKRIRVDSSTESNETENNASKSSVQNEEHQVVREPTVENDLEKAKINMEKKMERLKKEREELELSIKRLQQSEKVHTTSSGSLSIVEMYSRLLDTLNSSDLKLNSQDILPRVVVVGDQSAGKTSVLEMFAEARIFPRGSGEMMTRSPIQVTLTGGSEKTAQFKDEKYVYQLDDDQDLEKLRTDIEAKMKSSIKEGQAVSDKVISLTVRGSHHRIVLVDLPGVIGSVTAGMAASTKRDIYEMSRSFITNPNAIILCIQDGSVDAERSNITDLVNEADPKGERTIFVLTKVDLAEKSIKSDRIKKILDGRLFDMRALGYFAVITGTGNSQDTISSIKRYEETYFKSSSLIADKVLNPAQCTMKNLSAAITKIFWHQVRRSVDKQLESVSLELFKCEREYELLFGNRVISRDDAFGVSKTAILSTIHSSDALKALALEALFSKKIWESAAPEFLEKIYYDSFKSSSDPNEFILAMESRLSVWPKEKLAELSMETGKSVLLASLQSLRPGKDVFPEEDSPAQSLWLGVFAKTQEALKWPARTKNFLVDVQDACFKEDCLNGNDWKEATTFMHDRMIEYIANMKAANRQMFAPSMRTKIMQQEFTSLEQEINSILYQESRKLLKKEGLRTQLGPVELALIKKPVRVKYGTDIPDEQVTRVFSYAQKLEFMRDAAKTAKHCAKAFSSERAQQSAPNGLSCQEVVMFLRVNHALQSTGKSLRIKIFDLKGNSTLLLSHQPFFNVIFSPIDYGRE